MANDRDCENCKHKVNGACESWDCEFEPEEDEEFEPCEDAISRQELLNGLANIAKAKARSDAQKALMGRVMFFTEKLPPVNPQKPICPSEGVDCEDCPAYEPKTGHWIEYEKGYWSQVNEEGERDGWIPAYECSECGSQGWMDKMNYCPNCGAKMTEEDKA